MDSSVRSLHGNAGSAHVFVLGILFSAGIGIAPASGESPPRIRYIRIETENVFQEAESAFLPRAADAIHGVTRAEVVRRGLLFAEGDLLEPVKLAETERNLRALGLFRTVSITSQPVGEGEVDVLVRARDSWTTEVSGSLGR